MRPAGWRGARWCAPGAATCSCWHRVQPGRGRAPCRAPELVRRGRRPLLRPPTPARVDWNQSRPTGSERDVVVLAENEPLAAARQALDKLDAIPSAGAPDL